MAASKTGATWVSANSVSSGATENSASLDLSGKYGASLYIKMTNGATAPTTPCEAEVQASPNDSDWFRYGSKIQGSASNDGVVTICVPVDDKYKYVRVSQIGGDDQAVTFDLFYVTVDSL